MDLEHLIPKAFHNHLSQTPRKLPGDQQENIHLSVFLVNCEFLHLREQGF